MVSYDVFWKTLDHLGISKYQLVEQLGFSKGLMTRLNQNQNIKLSTVDEICNKLKITPDQVFSYTYTKVKEGKDITDLKRK